MAEVRRAAQEATRRTYMQYLTDTAIVALTRKGWGEKRIREFLAEWGKVFDEFHEALEDTVETDYVRAKFDERVKPLCPEKDYKAFEDRYKYLPDIKY